jgi:hypothetical protein
MVVIDVVLGVGIAVVFLNHFVGLGKASLELSFLLWRFQIGVILCLFINTFMHQLSNLIRYIKKIELITSDLN